MYVPTFFFSENNTNLIILRFFYWPPPESLQVMSLSQATSFMLSNT